MTEWRMKFEPVLTPVLRTWWRMRRSMTLGVRGVACDAQGRILLVRHGYAKGWHLPGGGVERLESAPQAVIREMAEEGGVACEDDPTLLGFYANHAYFPNDHIALYRVERWRACSPRAAAREIAERAFFPVDALPDEATPGTRRRVAEIFHGAPMSPRW